MRLRLVFSCIALVGFMVTPTQAMNSEEASLGRYVYKSNALNISLRIGVDGVKDLVIDNVQYPGVIPPGYSGVTSSICVYIVIVTDGYGLIHEIDLIDRFDEAGDVVAVSGFYSERPIESSGKASKKTSRVLVFQPQFTRIPIR
ncbi:MAG: hypothetical protein ACLPXT_15160 [Terracidiphilus sp.]